ncbi:sialate O-acetylesterase [Persicirhabdus sediminis]|uniref:Sialate O-acetylesterase domain-containing protein n=1 Tax=Persicirhabdus sediminis TaxID=454144 RepID=A0A8J7SL05_9BACT|nr:sialate O-acetylesterase [Persicirhabdus sediminis]MBK1792464.1 hypothetical protein [Persicirhabdus sediminis]
MNERFPHKIAGVMLLSSLAAGTAAADVSLPQIFTDHMILQQQSTNTIWGFADAGEKVEVTASWGESARATAGDDGKWKVFLPTPEHGTGHSLKVQGNNLIELSDVAIGEVWLCSGQSNMGWSLRSTFAGETEMPLANHPNLRIFKSQREHWHEPLDQSRDRLAMWKPCTPEVAGFTSAVSYWFGKKLHQELDVPVGIIVQAYAGTPIEAWMPWQVQENDPRAQAHRANYDAAAQRQIDSGDTREKAKAVYDKQFADYTASIDSGNLMKNKVKQLAPPTITRPADWGHQYPSNVFNAMINPVRPYGIRGMLWYQGERNSKDAAQAVHYRVQLPRMIDYYRSSWHELSGGHNDKDFPVYFTQLPSWNPAQTTPVEGPEATWAINREAMRLVAEECPNTGMSVAIDTGDELALHPKNKKPIGLRHAYLALKRVYQKDIVDMGPRYVSAEINDGKVTLKFDSVGSGMMAARDEPLDSFAIAGEDKVWHWAQAKIVGDTVVVSSPQVSQPAAVRYAWAMNPSKRNLLYNREGIPASPFRTDDWPLYDPEAKVITVNKPEKDQSYECVDWPRPEMKQ